MEKTYKPVRPATRLRAMRMRDAPGRIGALVRDQAGMVRPHSDPQAPNRRTKQSLFADSQAVPATTNIIAKSSLAALPTATVMSIMATPHDAGDACAP
jgi:hypothetical protein